MRPTYVSWDLRGLGSAHPAVELAAAQASCDGGAATYDNGRIRLHGKGNGDLRAACALGWRCLDEDLPVDAVEVLEQ
jgi:hypothetical protein